MLIPIHSSKQEFNLELSTRPVSKESKLDEESFEARDDDDDDDEGENTKQSTGGENTFFLKTGEKGTSSDEEENGEVEMNDNFFLLSRLLNFATKKRAMSKKKTMM